MSAHKNLTQVLVQVENGYPQTSYHEKFQTKLFTEYSPLTRELVPVCKEQNLEIDEQNLKIISVPDNGSAETIYG